MSRRNLGAARSAAERALFALNASDVGGALAALDEATALLRPPVVASYGPVIAIPISVPPAVVAEPVLSAPEPIADPAPKPPAKKARR